MIPDGIHYDIPDSVYRADPAYSYSRVKLGVGTMAEYKYALENPKEPTDEMIIGTLVDQLVFDGRFTNIETSPVKKGDPDAPKRAPNGWRKSVIASGKLPVTETIIETANGCAASLSSDARASRWLKSPGKSQVSMFLTHEGVRLKARIDRVPDKSTALCDLKKCQDASPGRFVPRDDGTEFYLDPKWARDVRDFGYHIQAGLYLWMWNQLAGSEDHRTDWVHICVEENPPHLVNVFQLGPRSIEAGRELFFSTLARIRECEASGKWPGYPEETTVVEVAI